MIWFAPITEAGHERTSHYIGSCHDYKEAGLMKKIAKAGYEASRGWYREINSEGRCLTWIKEKQKKMYFSIKPRGPRNGNYHVTPRSNATHFDVYMYERRG